MSSTALLLVSLLYAVEAGPGDRTTKVFSKESASLSLNRAPHVLGASAGFEKSVARAWDEAHERLGESESCKALFEPFGQAGRLLLDQTRYTPATIAAEKSVCREALAFTMVGSPVTHLCRSFTWLPREKAAKTLIHEALHYAGQLESPTYRGAPTSREISKRVGRQCPRPVRR